MCSGNNARMAQIGYRNGVLLGGDIMQMPNGGSFYTIRPTEYLQVDQLILMIDPVYFADYMILDTIVVEPVPEPAGFATMSLATAALYSRRRRSRRERER